ncbi:cupin [Paraburkholderia sp.]|uniref:cupin n=1 Tax=Paraburkholderia sp. TaxID=1926495 RepID=UPI0023A23A5E|nr:cupin [Paraburkholderia sp.]MDE1181701.1 cupin [Paraburkholderia sp.]
MYDDSRHTLKADDGHTGEVEIFKLEARGWVPNNRKLPVVVYRRALVAAPNGNLADAFEAVFERNAWPPQWRDGIFDYHHFHSTAHEVLGVASSSAEVIVGGPGGRVLNLEAGDVLLLPAGTGHCLQSFARKFQVVGAYPGGQQWDIRRDALTPDERERMESLPFPASDPVYGARGPVIETWVGAR